MLQETGLFYKNKCKFFASYNDGYEGKPIPTGPLSGKVVWKCEYSWKVCLEESCKEISPLFGNVFKMSINC